MVAFTFTRRSKAITRPSNNTEIATSLNDRRTRIKSQHARETSYRHGGHKGGRYFPNRPTTNEGTDHTDTQHGEEMIKPQNGVRDSPKKGPKPNDLVLVRKGYSRNEHQPDGQSGHDKKTTRKTHIPLYVAGDYVG